MATSDARRISVEIDNVLAGSTLTAECLVDALRRRPLIVFLLPFWVLRGKPFLRQRLARLRLRGSR